MSRLLRLLVVVNLAVALICGYGQAAEYNGPIIDVHMHANSPAMGKYRPRLGAPETLLEATIKEMDKNNIQLGYLSGDNDRVQEWVKAYPDRFIPSYNLVKPQDFNPAAWKAFPAAIRNDWASWKGLGELSHVYAGRPLNEPTLEPLLTACEKSGLPVFYHTGAGWPMTTTSKMKKKAKIEFNYKLESGNPLLLEEVAKKHPDLKIVICHMGWPFDQYAMALAKMHKNIYMDCSCLPWSLDHAHFHRILREAVGAAGSNKIAFGSDQMHWPNLISSSVQVVKEAGLSLEDQKNIFWNTPRTILGLDEKGKPAELGTTK